MPPPLKRRIIVLRNQWPYQLIGNYRQVSDFPIVIQAKRRRCRHLQRETHWFCSTSIIYRIDYGIRFSRPRYRENGSGRDYRQTTKSSTVNALPSRSRRLSFPKKREMKEQLSDH